MPAIGGSSARTAPKNFGRWVLDIRDFGAIEGDASSAAMAANDTAFARAFDALVPKQTAPALRLWSVPSQGAVYVPAGIWYTSKPVWLNSDGTGLIGAGQDRSIIQVYPAQPAILIGHPLFLDKNSDTEIHLDASHFFDLYGKLDDSAAGSTGQRHGLRTTAGGTGGGWGSAAWISAAGSPLSDYYLGGIECFIVEIAIDLDQTPLPAPGDDSDFNIAGVMADKGDWGASPWELKYKNGVLYFSILDRRSTDMPLQFNRITYMINRSDLPTKGVMRLVVQVNLCNATIAAWVNPNGGPPGADPLKQIPITYFGGLPLTKGLNWPGTGANPYYHGFAVGAGGSDGAGPAAVNLALCGLRVSTCWYNQNRYAADGVGQPIRRLDGQTINDYNLFFKCDDTGVLGLLPLDDDPATVQRTYMLSTQYGPVTEQVGVRGTAYFMIPYYSQGVSTNHTIKGLTVTGGEVGLAIGGALHIRIEDCHLQGQYHAIRGMFRQQIYPITISDCHLESYKAAPLVLPATVKANLKNIYISGSRHLMAFPFGGQAVVDNIFIPGFGGEAVFFGDGSLDARDVMLDNEGGFNVSDAFVKWCPPQNMALNNPMQGTVKVHNCAIGAMGPDQAVVDLPGRIAGDGGPGYCEVSWISPVGPIDGAAVVRVGDSPWDIQMQGIPPQDWAPILRAGSSTLGVYRATTWAGPPHWMKTFYQGAAELTVPAPAAGQPRRITCCRTGSYGTTTAPGWELLDPVSDPDHPNALATYLLESFRWTASSDPSIGGYFTTYGRALLLNLLLHGGMYRQDPAGNITAMPWPPGTLTWELNTIGPKISRRDGLIPRDDNNGAYNGGYAAPAYASAQWSAASGGAIATAQDLDFGTSTTAWFDWNWSYRFLRIALNTGGNSDLMHIGIDPLAVLAAGVHALYPAGKITGSRVGVPINGNDKGGFAPATWNAWLDSALRGVAYTQPALYLALSTAPADRTAGPVEPTGGGYARVAAPASAWSIADAYAAQVLTDQGAAWNINPLAFPSPTASWGTVRSVYLMDSPNVGQGKVIAASDLVVPRTLGAGAPAPSFAPRAFRVAIA
ncbi:MAG: hypothetical protein IRY99_03090 [Isosphaeraceae bacterium]|nr:hypothetical protein [Isosphaeraceae bacterium]